MCLNWYQTFRVKNCIAIITKVALYKSWLGVDALFCSEVVGVGGFFVVGGVVGGIVVVMPSSSVVVGSSVVVVVVVVVIVHNSSKL